PDSLSVNPSNRRGPSHSRRRSTGVATYGDAANDPARTLSGRPRPVNAVYEISTNRLIWAQPLEQAQVRNELRTHLVWYGVAAGAVIMLTLAIAAVVPSRRS